MSQYLKIENCLNEDKTSNRHKDCYDISVKFVNLEVEDNITYTFGDSYYGASFRYTNKCYVIDNGTYFSVENCIFKDNVVISINNPSADIKFINCVFEKDLTINSTNSNKLDTINRFILEGGKIEQNLVVQNVTANFKFYINPQNKKNNHKQVFINNLIIVNCKFIENFKLHNAIVSKFELEDVDFEKNADFYKSTFLEGVLETDVNENTLNGEIGFISINFMSLALFGDTEFHKKVIFRYVTFKGHNHFKSAKLHQGLDLEYTNIQQEINFYGIKILDEVSTSQETYRIIKHNFEKLGNKIEANKYHALELGQRKKELEKNKWDNLSDYIVFKAHDISSKHSTSWVRALFWIVFVSFFTIFLVHFDIVKDLLFNSYKFKIEYITKFWQEFWKYVYIGNMGKFNEQPFIFFLNKVLLGYLYYQFLMAVRKDTRK